MDTIKILGISGSLRKGSYNTAALHAAIELAPEGVTFTQADIGDIPLYNDDVREQGFPASVALLRQQIHEADAILFVSPEYNYSVPGVLKNAIDWASRAPDQPFAGKPAAVMGVSPGTVGTARMQYHLRQIAVFLDLKMVNRPEVMIGGAAQRFDAEGRLTDEPTRKYVQALVVSLRDLALMHKKHQ
jgi:chromate reductase